jgi:hypothetical protein
MVNIILPTIMKNGSVVDSVHINTLLSFVGGVKNKYGRIIVDKVYRQLYA